MSARKQLGLTAGSEEGQPSAAARRGPGVAGGSTLSPPSFDQEPRNVPGWVVIVAALVFGSLFAVVSDDPPTIQYRGGETTKELDRSTVSGYTTREGSSPR